MSAMDNKQLIEKIFADLSEGKSELLIDSLSENICHTIIGKTILSGTFCGKKEVLDHFDLLAHLIIPNSLTIHAERFITEGDFVVVDAKGKAITKKGKTYENTYCYVYRLVDGKIEEIKEYLDTEAVIEAFCRT